MQQHMGSQGMMGGFGKRRLQWAAVCADPEWAPGCTASHLRLAQPTSVTRSSNLLPDPQGSEAFF